MNSDELQIDHDVTFHRRFWKVQRIGWSFWALILVAAFLGFLGPGLSGWDTLDDRDAGMTMTYQRLVRANAATELSITLDSTSKTETQLAFNRDYIEAIAVESIYPHPARQEATESELVYTFRKVDTGTPLTVEFRYQPKKPGEIPIQVRLDNSAALFIKQFCFP